MLPATLEHHRPERHGRAPGGARSEATPPRWQANRAASMPSRLLASRRMRAIRSSRVGEASRARIRRASRDGDAQIPRKSTARRRDRAGVVRSAAAACRPPARWRHPRKSPEATPARKENPLGRAASPERACVAGARGAIRCGAMFCGRCHREYDAGHRFCPYDGAELTEGRRVDLFRYKPTRLRGTLVGALRGARLPRQGGDGARLPRGRDRDGPAAVAIKVLEEVARPGGAGRASGSCARRRRRDDRAPEHRPRCSTPARARKTAPPTS